MYPPGSEIRIAPGATADRWEGAARPGHFAGVLTVVAKLFHLAEPDVACFGRKDIQQATLIRQMVRDLDWPLELVVVPTVREPDGLALSSRNAYLDPDERRRAVVLSASLRAAHEAFRAGVRRAGEISAAFGPEAATRRRTRARVGTVPDARGGFPLAANTRKAYAPPKVTSGRATPSRSSSRSGQSGRRASRRSPSTARSAGSTPRRITSSSSSTESRSSAPRRRRS